MSKQTIFILFGGLAAAFFVAFLMQILLAPEPQEIAAPIDIPQTQILVAGRQLQKGDDLVAGDFRWQDWPEEYLFEGAITRDSLDEPDADPQIEGRLRRIVYTNEPMVEAALVQDDGNFVAATLGEGMRAVAIGINAETSAGGFVNPGDMVDVILTYRVEFSTEPEAAEVARRIVSSNAAQTVLENVRVMAVDQQAVDASEVGVGRTVTLEVTPKQAEELMLATEMGDLSLALRKIGDDVLYSESESSKTTTTDFRLSNITREVNESVEVDDEKTVKVFSGNQVQEVTITP